MVERIPFDQALSRAATARSEALTEIKRVGCNLGTLLASSAQDQYGAIARLQQLEARVLDLHTALNGYVAPGARSTEGFSQQAMLANIAFLEEVPDAIKRVTDVLATSLKKIDPPAKVNGYSARVQAYDKTILAMQAEGSALIDFIQSTLPTTRTLHALRDNVAAKIGYFAAERVLDDLSTYVADSKDLKPYQKQVAYVEIDRKKAALKRWGATVITQMNTMVEQAIEQAAARAASPAGPGTSLVESQY